ncbi:MAG TPA: TonB-dependent receptor [Candidatus Acidoferrales bacterium]|nr:TonB-dependent receptor [Candidatus Acidoferrales bacterium]
MKVSLRCLGTAILAACFLFLSHPALAQYRAGIQGVVQDPQGEVIPGATITLTNKDTNHTQQTTSGGDGVYNFLQLGPGHYSIKVEKTGFQTKTLADVVIAAEQVQAVNIQMEVGAVSQSVTVSASVTPAIDTETGEISSTLNSTQIQNLPAFGRDPYQLLQLAPGAFGDSAHNNGGGSQNIPGSAGPGGTSATSSIFQTENQVQVFANGQRNEANSFEVDGVSVNSLDWGGAAIITPNEESVKEVRVTTNSYDAEYGHGSGAQVDVVSQSGTNNYHGSFFWKFDRPGLNARQAYNGPSGPPADQRVNNRFNQLGGSVGGPVIKNRLFAFFSYETLRNNSVNTGTAWVETPQYLSAVQALSGTISSSMLNFPGEGASYSTVLPSTCAQAGINFSTNCQPAGTGLDIGSILTTAPGNSDPTYGQTNTPYGVGSGLDGTPDIQFVQTTNPTILAATQYNGRMDFQATQSDLVTFSVYWVPNDATFYNGQARAANLWHSDRVNYSGALLWDHTFSPTLINEARVNVSRWYFNEISSNPQEPWGLPQDTVTGLPGNVCCITLGANGPGVFYKTGYNIRDTATKVLARQTWKFGVDIYKEQNEQVQGGGARPAYGFNNLWDFANDAPVNEGGNFNPVTGVPTLLDNHIRDNDFAFFGQDDIKLRPNLTINLGLRWEYFGPFHDKNGALATAVLGAAPNQLSDISVRLGGNLYKADKHNWGPQIGFAWSPNSLPFIHNQQNRLVVRGGFGIGYNRTEDAITLNALTNPSPLFANFSLFGSNIVYAAPSNPHQFSPYPANPNAVLAFDPSTNLPTAGAPITLSAFPSYLISPYTYSYSLETQYDLGHNLIATVGYAGSSTHRELRWVFQGQILFDPQNPEVNMLRYWPNDVNGNHNALLTELQKRFSHGFELDAQYSFSRSMDESSTNYYFDQYPFTAQAAYGPSDYDATHNLKIWGLWTPKIFHDEHSWQGEAADGWTFSGIWNWHTGFPWTPFYGVDVANGGNTCSLLFTNSGYCNVRPAAYLGGAGTDHSNSALESGPTPGNSGVYNSNFSNGPSTYFTPPSLTTTGVPPVPGVGRNSFRGPHYSSLDFSIAKGFAIPKMPVLGEGSKLDVRFNFYNLFNQVNLAPLGSQFIGLIQLDPTTGAQTNPTTANDNHSFGQVCCGLAGRVIEAQARFSF